MRKLILLAAVIVLVALVMLLVNALGSRAPVAPLPPQIATQPTQRASTPIDATTEAHGDPRGRESAVGGSATSANAVVGASSLRIRVSFAQRPDHEPKGLELRVSDLLGVQRDAHRESPLEFLVRGLAPGDFVVAASESTSIGKTARAHVEKDRAETILDIELQPITSLAIHWKTPEGIDITSALFSLPTGRDDPALIVRASAEPLDPSGPRPEQLELASVKRELHIAHDAETVQRRREAQSAGLPLPRPVQVGVDESFATLRVPAPPPFEVSAWIDGVMLDSQTARAGQQEVDFVTSLDKLAQARVPVTCCIVDDVKGAPIPNLRVSVNESNGTALKMKDGCAVFEIDPGWTLLRFDTYFSREDDVLRERYAPYALEVHGAPGVPIELGTIRLAPARAIRLRVVDATGKPVNASEITLVRLATYDGTQAPFDLQRAWSNEDGIVTFSRVCREKYVAACTSPRLDSNPIVFDGSLATDGEDTIVGTIVLRPVRQVSLVFDVPPRVGTLMMIETPDGLPVHTLEMDEFGVVPVWLGGSDYRIHLVEGGEVTPSVPLTIDSDPCIRRIQR